VKLVLATVLATTAVGGTWTTAPSLPTPPTVMITLG
jgi:hypothetical protein